MEQMKSRKAIRSKFAQLAPLQARHALQVDAGVGRLAAAIRSSSRTPLMADMSKFVRISESSSTRFDQEPAE